MPYYIRDPKRDHNFDNHPHGFMLLVVGVRDRFYRCVKVFEAWRLSRFRVVGSGLSASSPTPDFPDP